MVNMIRNQMKTGGIVPQNVADYIQDCDSRMTKNGGGRADKGKVVWQADTDEVAELNALNTALVEAYEEEEIESLRAMLAENHIHNNVFGSKLDKETFLKDIETGILEFLRYETPEIEWVIRGDMAVATGLIEAEAVRGGKPVPATKFRFTRIYVKEAGEWKVLLFQNTMVGIPKG